MRIVIGDQVFETKGTPVVIKLSDSDKYTIANMPDDHFYYGIFPKGTDSGIKDKTFKLAGWKKEDNTENTKEVANE